MHRADGPKLVARLARELRSLDLAEDALGEAHVAALAQWPRDGIPERPAPWLLTVARRRAADRLRREATLARKLPLLLTDPVHEDPPWRGDEIPDERLAMLFASCHPALAPAAQVALTLRYVGGLRTPELARLLLCTEPAMAARITRAKHKIAHAGIPYRVPDAPERAERLDGVLAVVYLVFAEGYAATRGPALLRPEPCAEAIRLGRALDELLPGEPEVRGLLALMLLQHARRDARVRDGRAVPLADQDRARWRADEIDAGRALLAGAREPAGPYALQARIAAEHVRADGTDWAAVAALFERLEALLPSPVVRLSRAVAVAETGGPEAALGLIDGLDGALGRGYQLHAARAELLVRLGRREEAVRAYDRALAARANEVIRDHLVRRRAAAAR